MLNIPQCVAYSGVTGNLQFNEKNITNITEINGKVRLNNPSTQPSIVMIGPNGEGTAPNYIGTPPAIGFHNNGHTKFAVIGSSGSQIHFLFGTPTTTDTLGAIKMFTATNEFQISNKGGASSTGTISLAAGTNDLTKPHIYLNSTANYMQRNTFTQNVTVLNRLTLKNSLNCMDAGEGDICYNSTDGGFYGRNATGFTRFS